MRWTVTGIFAGLVTVACWSLFCLSLGGGGSPRVESRPHEASGRLMAQQAMALVAPGGLITVIARDTATFKNPATDIQLESFRREITKARAVIGFLHKLEVDPLRPIAVPSSEFCQAIRSAPDGSVIVSFMGPPQLTQAERTRLGKINVPIVAFCSGRLPDMADLRSLFDEGLLKAAVVDRRGADGSAASAANQRDGSEQSFVVLTASNLAEARAWLSAER